MRSPPVLHLLSKALRREVSTIDWPRETLRAEGPPHGFPLFDQASCTGCGLCVKACPSGCIALLEGEPLPFVDAGSCVTCGRCVEACSEDAVTLTREGPLVSHSRDDLVLDGTPPYPVPAGPPPSRLFRMAIEREGQQEVEPADLLRSRSGALLGPEDGR